MAQHSGNMSTATQHAHIWKCHHCSCMDMVPSLVRHASNNVVYCVVCVRSCWVVTCHPHMPSAVCSCVRCAMLNPCRHMVKQRTSSAVALSRATSRCCVSSVIPKRFNDSATCVDPDRLTTISEWSAFDMSFPLDSATSTVCVADASTQRSGTSCAWRRAQCSGSCCPTSCARSSLQAGCHVEWSMSSRCHISLTTMHSSDCCPSTCLDIICHATHAACLHGMQSHAELACDPARRLTLRSLHS